MDYSRRSKTKCSGTRPQCRRCMKRKTTCSWPRAQVIGTPESLDFSLVVSTPEIRKSIEPTVPPTALSSVGHNFPNDDLLQRLLNIFFARHHDVEFCSFLHKPTTNIVTLSSQAPFLVASIISISALYISDQDARSEFGFGSAAALSDHYTQLARTFAHTLSDIPSCQYASNHNIYHDLTHPIISVHNSGLFNFVYQGADHMEGLQGMDVRRYCHKNGPGSTIWIRI